MTLSMKPCSKCKVEKPLSEFQKDRGSASGFKSACKACANASTRAYKTTNFEELSVKKKAFRAANPDAGKATQKEWYERNKETEKAKALERYYARKPVSSEESTEAKSS